MTYDERYRVPRHFRGKPIDPRDDVRNELLEAVIEKEFDGDRSGLVCFAHWLEHRIAEMADKWKPGRPEWPPFGMYWDQLQRIRSTYADWMEVQRGGGLP